MSRDWARAPGWSEKDREEFDRHLRRARTENRARYLRTKAMALLESAEPHVRHEGRRLLRRIVEEYPNNVSELAAAHELLGEAYAHERIFEEAEEHYRACRALAPDNRSGSAGLFDLSLVEVVLDGEREDKYQEAFELLKGARRHMSSSAWFDSQLFRYHRAAARLAERLGDRRAAALEARAALKLARVRKPQPARHHDAERVHADDVMLAELQRLATG